MYCAIKELNFRCLPENGLRGASPGRSPEVRAGGLSFGGEPSSEVSGGTRTKNGPGCGEGGHCSALRYGCKLRVGGVEASRGL